MRKLNLIITGRLLDKNRLIGYRAWVINYNTLNPIIIELNNITSIVNAFKLLNCTYDKKTKRLKSTIRIKMLDYPKYNKNLELINSRYTESNIIAATLNKNVEDVRMIVCGALVYGAITDPLGEKAIKHAELFYEEIRHRTTDIQAIAKNTTFTETEILKIKNYLFMNSHYLDNEYRRFDPSFEIAASWQRLIENRYVEHDITLLKHELLEINLVGSGMDQINAHEYAQNQFNYGKESNEYYDKISKHNKRR